MSELRKTHEEFDDMKARWELCDACFEGEHGMHEEGETYLPRLQDESNESYASRLKITPFFNAFYRTVSGLRSMIFRKPPKVVVPEAVVPMLTDIDLAGTTLQGLAQEVAEDALVYGRLGLLVDYPVAPANATKADAAKYNLRPMIVKYDAESIYNWRTSRINGATVLSQVRLKECVEVQDPSDEFAYKSEDRYRVLDLVDGVYRQRVFKIVDNTEVLDAEVIPMMNGKPLSYIPFFIIGVDCIGADVEAPPLIDLATTNLHHYMQATSYERGCFFSGLPTLFVYGVNSQNPDGSEFEISIGGNMANILPRPDSRAEMVEVTSQFAALRTNLEDKKREMAVLGARMLESQKAGVEAADTVARRMAGEESLLSIMAQTLSMGITSALKVFVEWAGANGEVVFELNRDFMPVGMSAQDIAAIVKAWQDGAISQETMFDNLQSGEIIDSSVTFEEEQERIASTPSSLSAPAPQGLDAATVAAMIEQAVATAIANLPKPVEAPEAPEAQALDLQPIADAIAAMPAPVVNVAAPAAPTINLTQPAINVAAPTITIPEQQAPVVNVAPAAVNVAGATINLPDQSVTVNMPEQPAASVTVNNLPSETSTKSVSFERGADGRISGATVE